MFSFFDFLTHIPLPSATNFSLGFSLLICCPLCFFFFSATSSFVNVCCSRLCDDSLQCHRCLPFGSGGFPLMPYALS
ncbi:hypothetical protein F4809DRAFT_401876 [Biscogniauxia mediterranea]|nr:hypothetical protein F4809DRAFT_401876 [Biscogniauxia mediterranea]